MSRDSSALLDGPSTGTPRTSPLGVLVAGARREVAIELIGRLLADPAVAFVMGADLGPCPPGLRAHDPRKFAYAEADLSRRRAVDDLFLAQGAAPTRPNSVVHLAFEGDPGRYGRRTHDFNVDCATHLLEASLRSGVEKYVFLSSDAVYRLGPKTDYRVAEDSPINLALDTHPIVRDLVDAEFICRAKMDAPSTEVMVVRHSGVFGGGVVSGLNLLFESRPPLLPLGFDPMINPTSKERLADDLRLALRLHGKGIFNVAGPEVGPLSRFLEERGLKPRHVPGLALRAANRAQRWIGRSRYHASVNPDRLYFSLVLDDRRFERVFRSHRATVEADAGSA